MNKRQVKKLYKKIHGCNPTEGRIQAVLLKNPGKAKKSGGIRRMSEFALEAPACFFPPIGRRKTYENLTPYDYEIMGKWRESMKRLNSKLEGLIEAIKGKGDPVVITTRKLSENRKKNKGTAWRRVRRNR